ncbi:MAG: type III-A CRISPR-associated RAMP protein Csm5, partial [Chloroflexus sp.]|uniref:type III-A CRISPR-associated RAMP protein Csm5 n=1 Tax=Chloroflexus sp. TaxID=1904827 RepID=UPI00404A4DDE
MPSINQVYQVRVDVISPLCVLDGGRLHEEIDFYLDAQTTYVINSDAVLELAFQRWHERQPSREQLLARLNEREERLQQRRQRNIEEIKQFEASPPKDPRKQQEREQRLRDEANKIKEALKQLRQEREQLESETAQTPVVPPELLQNSGFSDLFKTGLLTIDDIRTIPGLLRYSYTGRPEGKSGQSEILSCVKDAADRLYLPGSSLKGALRTVLAWALAPQWAAQALNTFDSAKDKRQAARSLEQNIFYGRKQRDDWRVRHDLLRDVMRTFHIGDSQPVAQSPQLLQIRVFPRGSPITVEAIPDGTTLLATLRIEQYPFKNAAARAVIDFGDRQHYLQPAQLAAFGRQRAKVLIEGEQAFFRNRPDATQISRFYADLAERLAALENTNAFLLPIGWGAGWRSKTLDTILREGDREEVFVRAVHKYNMKLNAQRSKRFQVGDLFPASRRVIMRNGQPWLPLGWVCLTVGNPPQAAAL